MVLMYVSTQTVTESAIEDDDTKNKKQSCVRNSENKYYRIFFQPNYVCRISV